VTWMQTHTGRQFWPLAPNPEDVCLDDIAHALGLVCRFAGHCKRFYSVAEHSLYVAEQVLTMGVAWAGGDYRPGVADLIRQALLHDAAEAYLGDIIRPLKPTWQEYRVIEKNLLECIHEALWVPANAEDQQAIKHADNILLATEARDLMLAPPAPWSALPSPRTQEIPIGGVDPLGFGDRWQLVFKDPALCLVARRATARW